MLNEIGEIQTTFKNQNLQQAIEILKDLRNRAKDFVLPIQSLVMNEAGEGIEALYVLSLHFSLAFKTLKTTKVPFWRKFYSEKKGLEKYKTLIEDEGNCFEQIKMEVKKDAELILSLDWHRMVKAQLIMFLGVQEKITWDDYENLL